MLDKFSIVVFDARAITGVISADDAAGEAFTSRGVRYIAPQALNPFAAIRQAAHADMLRLGTRFIGGYAVAAEKAEQVGEIMRQKQAAWEAAKAQFLASYDEAVRQWVGDHPEVAEFVGIFPNKEWVRSRIGFEWTVIKIEAAASGAEGMRRMIGALPAQIISEIAQDVRSSWNPAAQKMNARTRGILVRVADKLDSLSFVGGQLGQMADKLRQVIALLPQQGNFSPAEMATASLVLGMLSSEETAEHLLTLDPGQIALGTAPAASETSLLFEDPEPEPPTIETASTLPVETVVSEAITQAEEEDEFFLTFG